MHDLRRCRVCVETPSSGLPLPHEPRPIIQAGSKARICIAGQAPGTLVNASGRPFTDPSGKRLRQWLNMSEAVFYDPDKVAIVPMGHCFPGQDKKGGDLPPRPECAPLWRKRVFDALPNLELILLVGQYSQKWHLGPKMSGGLTQTVAGWRTLLADETLPKLLPLPHPSWRNNSWLRQNPWFEAELLPVLKNEVARIIA